MFLLSRRVAGFCTGPCEAPLGAVPLGEAPRGKVPLGDEPLGDEPRGDEPLGDEPLGDGPLGDEPRGDEPLGDEPLGDEPLGDEPLGAALEAVADGELSDEVTTGMGTRSGLALGDRARDSRDRRASGESRAGRPGKLARDA